jgi:AAA domain
VSATKNRQFFLGAEEWLGFDPSTFADGEPVFGTKDNVLIGVGSKTLIEAPDKAFKTTFVLRLMAGLATGQTLFPELPVFRPRKVLYIHGELSKREQAARLQSAVNGLLRPISNLYQGRSIDAHFIEPQGQGEIDELIQQYGPEVVVFDPWQSFIAGYDENTYKDVSQAEKFIDRLVNDHDLTVFIPFHLGKNPGKGARGHSSLEGWRDNRMVLGRKDNTLTVKVEPRWAEPPDNLLLRFKDGTLWQADSTNQKWTPTEVKIRGLLQSHRGRLGRDELRGQLGQSKDAFRQALKRAQESNAVLVEGDCVILPLIN